MNLYNLIGQLTQEQTKELAELTLNELPDTDQWQLLCKFCREQGDDFTGELIAQLEDLE